MYSDGVYKKLHEWSESTLHLARSLLPLMTPVAQYEGWSPDERRTLAALLSASARSSESALLLTSYCQLWDADVLMRSVCEASVKFAYLLQDRDRFGERYQEYRHDLFRIALLKDHAKAADLLQMVSDGTDPAWKPMRDLLLAEPERAEISATYPQTRRRALETRWGFTGILGELVRAKDPLFDRFAGLAHGYAMASHVLHADHVGTAVPMDIDRRSTERREAMLLAQGVRLLSDVTSCLQFRLSIGYRFINHSPQPLFEAQTAISELHQSFGTVYEDWMATEYPPVKDT